jgi:hypothetical protein
MRAPADSEGIADALTELKEFFHECLTAADLGKTPNFHRAIFVPSLIL